MRGLSVKDGRKIMFCYPAGFCFTIYIVTQAICDEIERNRSDLSSTSRHRDKVGGGGGVCRESTLPGRALNFLP